MGQLTQTTAQVQVILDDADAANVGKTSLTDGSDTTSVAFKKSGFYSLQGSSANAPSTDRAVLISAVRDTAATGEIRYGQIAITESNGLWWNRDDGGSLGTWYEAVTTASAQTLTNKTLTSPILTTPQINDSAADHQYIFAGSNLAADRTVTLPLLTGDDTFVFAAHTQTLTNKTLTTPTVSGLTLSDASIIFEGATANDYETTLTVTDPTADRTITLPDATDTLVGRATTDTLTNKTLTSPVASGLTLSDASIVFEGATADAYETTLTVTDPTADRTITLPNATDTLVGLATTDTLTNKTLTSPVLNTGVSGTAVLDADDFTGASATTLATSESIKAYVDSQVGSFDTLSEVLAAGNTTGGTDIAVGTGDDITFADSSKAIFGAGDLQIYHDGTSNDSIIDEAGTGNLNLQGTNVVIKTSGGSATQAEFFAGDANRFYYNNALKLATTATGVDVTGSVDVSGGADGTIGDITLAQGNTTSKIAKIYGTSVNTNEKGIRLNTYHYGDVDAVTITSDGSVGIGISSPDTLVHAYKASNAILKVAEANGYVSLQQSGVNSYLNNVASGGSLIFRNGIAPTERMQIDASGNLLVGKTTLEYSSNAGHVLRNDGLLSAVRSGGNVCNFNRLSSDGEVIQLNKDGVRFGSIGTVAGDLTIGDDDIGIRFDTGTGLVPWDLGANATGGLARDAAIDIGASSARFKDLYLSGVARLGTSTTYGTVEGKANSDLEIVANAGQVNGNPNIIFKSSNAGGAVTERMRITSEGFLLVGTTDTAPGSGDTNVGVSIRGGSDNRSFFSVNGDYVMNLNRNTDEGDILQFRRDGTAVGSIGTLNTNRLYFGGADTGIMIASDLDCIYPTNGGDTARDNAVDLGNSGTRFKDLYLSGASLAGAGSASSPSISFSGDTNTGLYSGGADNINFATGGAARAFMSATQFNMTGNGVFSGSISKGSGSFKIDHPLPEKTETHHLVHSFVESPQADNIYRGKVDLVDGSATVNIDDAAGMTEGTYVLLNTNTQCFTSNESGWTAVKGSVSGNTLTITAQDNTCTDTISWMVIGERHDQHMLDTEWTDENGRVIVEPLKES
jgi:hypothetical protein